jgi:hypothetical protein
MKSHDFKNVESERQKKKYINSRLVIYDKCRVLKKSEDKFLTKGQPAYKR